MVWDQVVKSPVTAVSQSCVREEKLNKLSETAAAEILNNCCLLVKSALNKMRYSVSYQCVTASL